jgi:hypothetical protein
LLVVAVFTGVVLGTAVVSVAEGAPFSLNSAISVSSFLLWILCFAFSILVSISNPVSLKTAAGFCKSGVARFPHLPADLMNAAWRLKSACPGD